MEANIIIEINSVLDDKQNVEIRQILKKWVSYFQCNLFYERVNQSSLNQIHAVSSNHGRSQGGLGSPSLIEMPPMMKM